MTQSLVQVSSGPPQQKVDALKRMLGDLEVDRKRLKDAPPGDLTGVVREIANTVFEYQKDILLELISQRDWAAEVVDSIDDRVSDLEGGGGEGGTQLLPEDAEKFKALALGVDHVIATVSSMQGVSADVNVMKAFGDLRNLAKECLQIIEDTTLEVDDEEEEEPGEAGSNDARMAPESGG